MLSACLRFCDNAHIDAFTSVEWSARKCALYSKEADACLYEHAFSDEVDGNSVISVCA
jgi:hypothetical protein